MWSLLATVPPALVAAQVPSAPEPSFPGPSFPGSSFPRPRRTVPAPGNRTRWTDSDPRWVVGVPKPLGPSLARVAFPVRLDLPPTGRLVPWRAASTTKWTTYVRVLPLVGAPRPVSVALRDLGSGLSIETMSLYRGDGDRRLLGTLSSTVTGVQGAKRLVWNPKAATIRIEYADEPALVTPAVGVMMAIGARR